MNRDDAPLSSGDPSVQSSAPGWRPVFIRLALAAAFFVAALAAIAGALSKLSPRLLTQALTIFFGWPWYYQALAILAALIIVAAVAAGKQIIQNLQQATMQRLITDAAEDAISETIAPDISQTPRWLEQIYRLLDVRFPAPAPRVLRTVATGADHVPGGPDAPILGVQEADHTQPHDDAQFAPPANWVNRERELERLTKRLLTHRYEEDVTVVIGISGIGKTALIAKATEQIKSKRYGDSIALVWCAGLHDPVAVVRKCLERVDPRRRIPLTLDLTALQQMSEELLGGRDFLLVLDGVEPSLPLASVVRALRTERRSAHILVTTTMTPTIDIAPVASQLHLDPMQKDDTGRDDALKLFAKYAGLTSSADFGERVEYAIEIVEALERHTYALQLMGAYAQGQLNILRGIADDVKRLKEGIVTTGVEAVLRPVWVAMTKVVDELPDESRILLFAFVSAFGGTEAGQRATRAIGHALGLHDVDNAIHVLVQNELMQSFETKTMPEHSDRQRLRIHTLLRGYLKTHLNEFDWEERSERARDALAEYYAVRYIKWYDDRPDPTRITQRALSPDADNITHALEWAVRRNQHEHVVALAHGMRRFWHDRWLNDKTQRFMPTAVASATLLAKRAKNRSDEQFYLGRAADLAFTLGRVYRRIGRLRDAEPLFQQDLAFRKHHRQYSAQAESLHQLAQLERSRGRMRKALDYCGRGLSVVRWHIPRGSSGSDVVVQKIKQFLQAKGLLIAQQGRIERSRGNLRRADALFTQAYDLFKQTDDKLEQGVALGYRGRIARVLGDINTAEDFFDRSDALAREVYDFRGQGVIATQRGRIARTHGELDTAKRAFTEGLNKAQQVLDKQAVAVNLNYLGRIANTEGNTLEAEEKFNQALQIAREIDDRLDEGVNLGYLGRVARKREFLAGARAYFMQSLKILREVEDHRGEALNRAELALVDIESRHLFRASRELKRSLELIRLVGDKRSEGSILRYQGQLDFAKRNLPAARMHFTAALDLARAQGDAGGLREAQQWLDKLPAIAGQETSQRM